MGSTVHIGPPKTQESRRIAFGPTVAEIFARAIAGKAPDDLLFPRDYDGGPMANPDSRDGWFAAAVRRCRAVDPGFPKITPHMLRHTYAALAVSAGANVKSLSRQLGHTSISMTLDTYAFLFDDDLDAVAAAVEGESSAA